MSVVLLFFFLRFGLVNIVTWFCSFYCVTFGLLCVFCQGVGDSQQLFLSWPPLTVLYRTCQDVKCCVFSESCFVSLCFFAFWVGECCDLVLWFFTTLCLVCFLFFARGYNCLLSWLLLCCTERVWMLSVVCFQNISPVLLFLCVCFLFVLGWRILWLGSAIFYCVVSGLFFFWPGVEDSWRQWTNCLFSLLLLCCIERVRMVSVMCFQNISVVLLFLWSFFSFWVGECCNLVLRFFTVLFLVCFFLSAFCRELKTINQLFVFLTAVSPHRTCPGGKCCVFPEY